MSDTVQPNFPFYVPHKSVLWVGERNYITFDAVRTDNQCSYRHKDSEECFLHLEKLGVHIDRSSNWPIHACWTHVIPDYGPPPVLHPAVEAFFKNWDNEGLLGLLPSVEELENIS